MTFETLVDESRKLKLDDLETFIDILKNAAREKRRRAIATRGRRAIADCKAGKCFEGVDNLMKAAGYAEN
jgi:hypothetical protein